MGKVSEYAFLNSKLRAKIGLMKESRVLEDMIKAPSLVEAISTLKETKHKHIVEVYDKTGDLQQVELALLEEEISVHRDIVSYLNGREGGFINIILEKVEIDNLKNAVRLWYSNVVRHHQISYRSSYIYKEDIVHSINYNKIINASGYQDVIQAVSDTPYFHVFERYSYDDLVREGLFYLEISLDHLWFNRLFEGIERLKGEDRKVSSSIYMVDVDLKNILLYIRYKYYHHISMEDLEKVIIPYGYIYEKMKDKRIFSMPDSAETMRTIVKRRYPELLEALTNIRKNDDELTGREENARHILIMEDYLGRTRSREFTKILSGNPFTIGITLAYLFLYKDEDRLIRAILSAKYYKWDESRIREAFV